MKMEKSAIKKIGAEAVAMNKGAELEIAHWDDESKMMEAALQWINETEAEVLKLRGARELFEARKRIEGFTEAEEKAVLELPEIYQRQRELILSMLKYLQAARQSHKNNDSVQTIRWFPIIEKEYKMAMLRLQRIKEIESGGLGGSKPKRRLWAEEVAEYLKERYQKLKKEDVWEKIPQSFEPLEIKTDEVDYDYAYRDGEYLVGENSETEKVTKIKKSTFFKNYYIKGE